MTKPQQKTDQPPSDGQGEIWRGWAEHKFQTRKKQSEEFLRIGNPIRIARTQRKAGCAGGVGHEFRSIFNAKVQMTEF